MVFKDKAKKISPQITIPENLDNNEYPRRDIHTWEVEKDKLSLVNWEHGDLGGGLREGSRKKCRAQ